jgi:tetratricopeptide (TPR) repeat protein
MEQKKATGGQKAKSAMYLTGNPRFSWIRARFWPIVSTETVCNPETSSANRESVRMQRVDEITLDQVFEAVITAPVRSPAASLPRRLSALFQELQRRPPKTDPEDIAELIWAIWIHHSNEEAASAMTGAVEAMAAGAFDLALPILNRLVADYPDWPEAWNKRATVHFSEKRDNEALADIGRTLAIEPRHFGAMIGFAQICMRHRRFAEAKPAFETARRLHPYIPGLDTIIADLNQAERRKH